MHFRKLTIAASTSIALLACRPADALVFSFTDQGGAAVGTQARADFEIAGRYWSSVLTNNVTVNLGIAYQPLDGFLGLTTTDRVPVATGQVYAALAAGATTPLDRVAVANLSPLAGGAVTALANGLDANATGYVAGTTRLDNDASANNRFLSVGRADAKALGIKTGANGPIDGTLVDATVTLNSTAPFDFDPGDGIGRTSYDFLMTAIHEIGHALGFISGVEAYDLHSAPNGPQATAGSLEGSTVATPLDLFRYSDAGTLDWRTGGAPYLSVDGGASQLFGDSMFSTGTYNGDGNQPLHWKDNAKGMRPLGIMDPNSGMGQSKDVTALDLAAFDAIGWDSAIDVLADSGYDRTTAAIYREFAVAPVPEPGTSGLLAIGVIALGARRRKSAAAKNVVS